MSEQQLEVKTLTGTPMGIEPNGEYEGRAKYKVSMLVPGENGTMRTMQLDVTMPPSDPAGKPPFETGKQTSFDYTRRPWNTVDRDTGLPKTIYFYNYRWPSKGGGGGFGGGARRPWVDSPKIVLRAATVPNSASTRTFSVELSCPPTDNLAERGAQLLEALRAMEHPELAPVAQTGKAMSTAPAQQPQHDPIEDEPPF